MSGDSAVLLAFFRTLEAECIPYCVVGDVAGLPRIPANDIDIVCAAEHQDRIGAAIHVLAERFGGQVAQVLQHESNAFYRVLYLPDGLYLKLDVCSDYVVAARRLLTAAWLLEGRRKVGGRAFFTCAPEREFAYYLMKKISKGYAADAALRHLGALFDEAPAPCRAVLTATWAADEAAGIERAVLARDWQLVKPSIGELRRQMTARHPRVPSAFFAEARRVAARVLQPSGFTIAVLGPDGSGKSTLLDALQERLAPLGRGVARFHLKPPLTATARAAAAPVDNPHGRAPRGLFLSTLKLGYFAVVYTAGWLSTVWLLRRRSHVVLFDRYYHDILADPLRYRNGAPAWTVRFFARFVPRPDLFLILDASPNTVRARKAEVSAAESERQHAAYRALAHEIPGAHLVDANAAAEIVAGAGERLVVQAMAQRLSERGFRGQH
ncbi:MAG: hypothetical protein HOP13_06145 [Alphaproteobacteria bacterium]|nr:hypothetical protein [Alphaproteobacteria bacterium]